MAVKDTTDLLEFFDEVEASLDSYTQMIRFLRLPATSSQAFANWLGRHVDPTEHWSYATFRREDGSFQGIAAPTADIGDAGLLLFPFLEIHQVMVVWWLTAAWRAEQMIRAVDVLNELQLVVPTAACARGLVETAAQLHADASKVAAAWDSLKRATEPARVAQSSTSGRLALLDVLNEATLGGKFDDKVPTLKESFGRFNRSNVLTAVEKLSKAFGPTWQQDYQWLCNVVHPSVGNHFAFSSPALKHDSGTHILVGFSGVPIALRSGSETQRQELISTAVRRAVARSAQVMRQAMDDALRVLDDVALTTRAAEMSTFPYWRALVVSDRQGLCPCRSGLRAYRCVHKFGEAGPVVRPVVGA